MKRSHLGEMQGIDEMAFVVMALELLACGRGIVGSQLLPNVCLANAACYPSTTSPIQSPARFQLTGLSLYSPTWVFHRSLEDNFHFRAISAGTDGIMTQSAVHLHEARRRREMKRVIIPDSKRRCIPVCRFDPEPSHPSCCAGLCATLLQPGYTAFPRRTRFASSVTAGTWLNAICY